MTGSASTLVGVLGVPSEWARPPWGRGGPGERRGKSACPPLFFDAPKLRFVEDVSRGGAKSAGPGEVLC